MSLSVSLSASVDTGGTEPHVVELYRSNITHNLGKMAHAAGIYQQLWRPDEIGITKASELIAPLTEGLALLRSAPERFKQYDASNGWGTCVRFVPWVEAYLGACVAHPKADIHVSR